MSCARVNTVFARDLFTLEQPGSEGKAGEQRTFFACGAHATRFTNGSRNAGLAFVADAPWRMILVSLASRVRVRITALYSGIA
jgi:hypothetical protein